jgi:hypothetical protein
MENGQARPPSPALPSAAPQVIFVNWREALHLLKLGRGLKYLYVQAIGAAAAQALFLAHRADLPGMGVAAGAFRGGARESKV